MKTNVPMLDTTAMKNDVLLTIIEYIAIMTGMRTNTSPFDIDSRVFNKDYYLVCIDGELQLYKSVILESESILRNYEIIPYDKYDFLKAILKLKEKTKVEKIKEISTLCNELYLDYFNNFITTGRFAEYYGISDKVSKSILTIGREASNE